MWYILLCLYYPLRFCHEKPVAAPSLCAACNFNSIFAFRLLVVERYFTRTLHILPISTSLLFFHSTRTFPTSLLKSSTAAIPAGGLNILLPHVGKLETKMRWVRSSNAEKRINKRKTHTLLNRDFSVWIIYFFFYLQMTFDS